MSGSVTPDSPAAPRRLRLLGIATVIGLVLAVGGAIALWVSENAEAVFAADRAEIPQPLEFEAGGVRYRIMLLADPVTPSYGNAHGKLLCEVELADGTRTTIDTGSLVSRAETDFGIELGSFDAVAGPTTVTCDWKDGGESRFHFYSVAPSSPLVAIVGIIALVAGIVLLTLGTVLILRARMRSLTKRRPLSTDGEAAGPPPPVV